MHRLLTLACSFLMLPSAAFSQSSPAPLHPEPQLRYVVYLSRHGVRSPTGKAAQYNLYSSAPWPEWPVSPGYLTPHGFHLMELFGAFDRSQLAAEKFFQLTGCQDAASTTIYADSDQRTRETGKALAQGLFPGCSVAVQSLPEGTNDPLFHPVPALQAHLDPALATAAVAGRIAGNAANLTLAYQTQLAALDHLLSTCGTPSSPSQKRTSLLDIPATLAPGSGDHLVDLKGPINTAATLSENLLLEYTEGMDEARVGWGCVHRAELESLMDLHTASTDFAQRTPAIAQAQASNLLFHIERSIEQVETHKPVPGALGKPEDRALFLVGHDTNLENIAGLLNLTWIVDGRRDDTPPGSALVFELWQKPSTGAYFVRTYFTAQTLDQMRSSTVLNNANAPDRVSVFIPGCGAADQSCPWPDFSATLLKKINTNDVVPQ